MNPKSICRAKSTGKGTPRWKTRNGAVVSRRTVAVPGNPAQCSGSSGRTCMSARVHVMCTRLETRKGEKNTRYIQCTSL